MRNKQQAVPFSITLKASSSGRQVGEPVYPSITIANISESQIGLEAAPGPERLESHFAVIAVQADGQRIKEKEYGQRIALAIATQSDTYKIGEAVLLKILVKNISSGDYCESHFLETGEAELNGYDVYVRDSGGTVRPQIPLSRERLRRSRGKLCIKPDEILKESLVVNQVVDLSTPGVYQISVNHLDRETNIHMRSNSITVTITP
jgi:hypothetical protein